MSYFSKLNQDVRESTNNSSAVNLGAGATFTGVSDSTLGVNAIQVSLKTDQNCTVYIDQSPDGVNWDIVDDYEYLASLNNFGVTVQAINSYFRVRVTNMNATTGTSYFRLQSVLCPIVECLPRSLSEKGYLKTAIFGIEDEYGFGVENTPMGEMRTVSPVRVVGAQFEGTTVDPNFWTVTNANGGTSTQANAQLLMQTNTPTPNGSTSVHSVVRGRYISGSSMGFRAIMQIGDTGTANNKRRWGIAWGATMPTITDGAFFELDGTTFSVVTMKGTVEARVSSGSFNGALGASYALTTNATTFEIYWTNSKVYFVIGDEILHTVTASAATWAATMTHHVFLDNANYGGQTLNVTMACRVVSIRRFGQLTTQPRYYNRTTTTAGVVLKYSAGNIHSLAVGSVAATGCVITLYDGTSVAGNIIYQTTITYPGGGNFIPMFVDFKGVAYSNGLFLVVANQNASVTVNYE